MEPRETDAFRWARSVCRSAGFEPQVRFESPDPYVHRRLVEQGLAAAFLPATVAAEMTSSAVDRLGSRADMHRTLLSLVRRGTERAAHIQACQSAIELAVEETLRR